MVQVRKHVQVDHSGGIDLQQWLQHLPTPIAPGDSERLLEACQWAQRARAVPASDPGCWAREADCFSAGLDIGLILSELHVGVECLVAGILYRAVRESRIPLEEVRQHFGDEVGDLIDGVLRMAAIGYIGSRSETPVLGQAHGQKDNIRKMLIALVDDVRVALIKLAERTCAIRAVKDDDLRRQPVRNGRDRSKCEWVRDGWQRIELSPVALPSLRADVSPRHQRVDAVLQSAMSAGRPGALVGRTLLGPRATVVARSR